MQNQIGEVLEWNVTPGLELDSVVLMNEAMSMVKAHFGDPKLAAGLSCIASFADLPSGSSFIVRISVRIDPKDGEAAIRVESLAEFDNADEMRMEFDKVAKRFPVS
jgi:hypothetical protein